MPADPARCSDKDLCRAWLNGRIERGGAGAGITEPSGLAGRDRQGFARAGGNGEIAAGIGHRRATAVSHGYSAGSCAIYSLDLAVERARRVGYPRIAIGHNKLVVVVGLKAVEIRRVRADAHP